LPGFTPGQSEIFFPLSFYSVWKIFQADISLAGKATGFLNFPSFENGFLFFFLFSKPLLMTPLRFALCSSRMRDFGLDRR